MQLTDTQIEGLKNINDKKPLMEIVDGYISEIKDDVIEGKLSVEAGREAITLFKDFKGKLSFQKKDRRPSQMV